MIKGQKKIPRCFFIIALFLSVIVLTGCRLTKKETPKYIFLITLDTLRADHVDYSLENNKMTPNLARLASEGIYFPNAYSLIPITLPSHLAMFYSLPPHILKVYNNGEKNSSSLPGIEKILKKKGYSTGAVIALGSISKQGGIGKDFDEFIENYRKPYLWYKSAEDVNKDAFSMIERIKTDKSFFWIHYSDPHDPYYIPAYKGLFSTSINGIKQFTSKSTERALVKIEAKINPGENIIDLNTEIPSSFKKDKRLAINCIAFDDFSIISQGKKDNLKIIYPEEWKISVIGKRQNCSTSNVDSRIRLINKSNEKIDIIISFLYRMIPTVPSIRILYKQEVRYMDKHIGQLIDFLKKNNMYKDSVFIIMGDHGEGLGEYRQHVGHIDYLNKCFVNVPLIVCGEGIRLSGIRKDAVTNLNIAPTILAIGNIKIPAFMMGKSLLSPLEKERIVLETYSPEARGDAFSIIDFPFQIIAYPKREKNKLELINLEKDSLGIKNLIDSDIKPGLKSSLIKAIQEKSAELSSRQKSKSKISKKDEEILKALGYIK